ncbi:MAG: glutamate--cysteine ligase [Micromonosporaceae bacterium]|nr:glutamate--cysteine ligase [Micromonosporaceae bacterium]
MGKDVSRAAFTRADRSRYRLKLRRCLEVFAVMLREVPFETGRQTTGLELEVNLVDESGEPAMRNAEVLAGLADSAFQTELGQFNLELNATPRLIAGDGFDEYEGDLLRWLWRAEERAVKADARLVTIGILPTLGQHHAVLENISPDPRYHVLNEQMLAARGEDFGLDIRGVERLRCATDSIAPEAACTSLQFHLLVAPEQFASYWNAAQALAGVQVAVGANSPYLFGKQLWAETRIALFEQATDTRPEEFKAQGVRPRVWFGERWITSVVDLFEENLRYFPALLPILEDEDPAETLRAGGVPRMSELRLHNGTVYRWNRPVIDVSGALPHLRVENRVLPAGPTVVDMLANAAFYFGLVRSLAEAGRPLWTRMPFSLAEANFHVGARHGLAAGMYWPGLGEVPVGRLVLDELLPMAYAGLDAFGVAPPIRDRLLGVIEQRCRTGRNGAAWQVALVDSLERAGLSRTVALGRMLRRYTELHATNEPVHSWPIG